jgi:DNA-binding transcriptional LysR family regulator
LKTLCRGESGRLSIGVYAAFSARNLHATFADHRRRFPEGDLRMADGTQDRRVGDLVSNTIDIAILTDCGSAWDDRTLPLWSERVIALPEQCPLTTCIWPISRATGCV